MAFEADKNKIQDFFTDLLGGNIDAWAVLIWGLALSIFLVWERGRVWPGGVSRMALVAMACLFARGMVCRSMLILG